MEIKNTKDNNKVLCSNEGTRTLLIQMSGKIQQSKHTRKHEGRTSILSLVSSTIKRTLGKKMPRKKYYKMK
jgi:hypothetical protein